ncbi:hypothetical protein K488DRAFT_57565 [Vararia minispora EC-137]|uniref:Uncharacterized protein n=1 Tax=Vararia minispora EC-137 TaxID=1314806 RepID=A0ACB8QAR9_9AGAM|nr:hypothetical protein K488DRAFT_57565 [Vararia minispora EC-137]
MTIALVPAELAGTAVETLLFGVYLVTFAMCMHVLFSDRHRQTSGLAVLISPMTLASLFLFASIVSHWVLDIVRLFDAFIYGRKGSPLAFYAYIRDGKNVVKTALYIAQVIVVDMIMVYRLFHVYQRSWRICVFPIVTITTSAVSGAGITWQFSRLDPGVDIFTSECGRWIATAFSSTLLCGIFISTPVLAHVDQQDEPVRNMQATSIRFFFLLVHIVVESAAIYTACTLVTFVSYLAHSNLQFPSLDASSPVIGIVFCLIIVRIRLFGNTHFHVAGASAVASADAMRSKTRASVHRMETLAVSVHREIEVVGEGSALAETPGEGKTAADGKWDSFQVYHAV